MIKQTKAVAAMIAFLFIGSSSLQASNASNKLLATASFGIAIAAPVVSLLLNLQGAEESPDNIEQYKSGLCADTNFATFSQCQKAEKSLSKFSRLRPLSIASSVFDGISSAGITWVAIVITWAGVCTNGRDGVHVAAALMGGPGAIAWLAGGAISFLLSAITWGLANKYNNGNSFIPEQIKAQVDTAMDYYISTTFMPFVSMLGVLGAVSSLL